MFTKRFWIDALERAIKTFAQTLLATGALDVVSVDLATSLQTKALGGLMAAGVSILTSIVSSGFGQKDSASMIDTPGDDGHADIVTVLIATACAIIVYLVMAKVFKV